MQKIYAVKHKDNNVLMTSSSGGAFTALSDAVLHKNGVIVCPIYNTRNSKLEYELISDEQHRDNAKGSKYFQAYTYDIFKKSFEWLSINDNGVLMFVGTGCTVAGFKSYIKANKPDYSERILFVDLICHGVPSPEIWQKYINTIRDHNRILKLTFKDKRDGWLTPTAYVKTDNAEHNIKPYVRIMASDKILRPCCYRCPFSRVDRESDITIGDYWGVEKIHPDFFDNRGVSLFIIHSDKGRNFFEDIQKNVDYIELPVEECLQPNLLNPTSLPLGRNELWRDYENLSFGSFLRRYGRPNIALKIKSILSR